MNTQKLFSEQWLTTPEQIRELINFSPEEPEHSSMAVLQSEGVAALYNYLCRRNFAYLADEVGTGKTYQALGVIALVWHLKPDARILVITPRQSVQVGWLQEYERFFRTNYLAGIGGDDRAGSLLLGTPIHASEKIENLREWLVSLKRPHRIAAILRHTSFMRPIFVDSKSDPETVWGDWRQKLAGLGLFDLPKRPKGLSSGDASRVMNLEFAEGLNQFLGELENEPTFDLVVVDEAQCLRNPDNQSNSVLHSILKNRVRKWLFLSATPAHSGVADIANVLNHYPNAGDVISDEELNDLSKLQKKLQQFMVRRPRAYVVGTEKYTKDRYRQDLENEWAEVSQAGLATLAMGLIQKRLVPVLQKKSYRYHIGLLSSFESLQTSVRHLEKPRSRSTAESSDAETTNDYFIDNNDRASRDLAAPDSGFIDRLNSDFHKRFDFPLPHPKLDRVVREVADLAFGGEGGNGTNPTPGGEKLLVFTRRISTVAAMRERLEAVFQKKIEERVSRCWKRQLDWIAGTGEPLDDETDSGLPNDDIEQLEEGSVGWRTALQEDNWLGRFRRTFRDTGRNAMFFEENWLRRLCFAGGREPTDVAKALPSELWAESWAFAARHSGKEISVQRANRLHYLAYHGVSRVPEIFGLNPVAAHRWQTALRHILPAKSHDHWRENVPADPRPDARLFTEISFWNTWDEIFPSGPLHLGGTEQQPLPTDLYRRKVLQTIIAQTITRTDALVDLYCCARQDQRRPHEFLSWLADSDKDAVRLRHQFANWIAHLELILTSALGENDSLEKLAQRSAFEQLNRAAPVIGITGGSGGNQRATQQFRTPGYPLVIVCTDTLKEGVNLHLFCDRVVHYGIAWTSGDLEQRIGRVDRYFGLIERRLKATGGCDSKLSIYYPYVANSLERDQVRRVIERKRQADALMDSPLSSGIVESKEININYSSPGGQRVKLSPFSCLKFPTVDRVLVSVDRKKLLGRKQSFERWAREFTKKLAALGIEFDGTPSDFRSSFQLRHIGRSLRLEWRFDADLRHYCLRISRPLGDFVPILKSQWIPFYEQDIDRPGHEALLVPDATELDPGGLAQSFHDLISGKSIARHQATWLEDTLGVGRVCIEKEFPDGRYTVRISYGTRSHAIDVLVLEGVICASAVIVTLDDLPQYGVWEGSQSKESIRGWAKMESYKLPVGAIDLTSNGQLRYAATMIYSLDSDKTTITRFIELVGMRADLYEAALTGDDVY